MDRRKGRGEGKDVAESDVGIDVAKDKVGGTEVREVESERSVGEVHGQAEDDKTKGLPVDPGQNVISEAITRALRNANLESMVKGSLALDSTSSLVYTSLTDAMDGLSIALTGMDTPSTIPHFYQLRIVRGELWG